MRSADAIELLDVRAFIKTNRFEGELFHPYQRGDPGDIECESIQAEIQDGTLVFHATGRHRSDPGAEPWSHDYSYHGAFMVHWTDR